MKSSGGIRRVRSLPVKNEMKKYYFQYFAALLLFGSNGLAASFIHLPSDRIVLLRSVFGGALLLALFLLSGQRPTAFRHGRDLFFLALSGTAMAADWLLLFEAYRQIGVSLGMLINYCGPVIVMALSPLVFRERVAWPKAIALAAAMAGVFCVSGQAAAHGVNGRGLLCAGLSALSYAAMVICNKKAARIEGMENAAIQMLFALLAVAAVVGCRGGFSMAITDSDWLPILWLGVVNTGVSCYFYFTAIGKLPVQTVAVCGYLEPLFAVLLSVLFLHESLRPVQILGAILILGGAVLGECASRKPRPIPCGTKRETA